jgi:hypothetical protein
MASPHRPFLSMRRMFARLLLTQYILSTFYAIHTGWPSYFSTGDPFWYSFLRGLRGWPIKAYNWYAHSVERYNCTFSFTSVLHRIQ